MSEIENKLKQVFGFDGFRPGQQQVIDQLLAGHSAAAVFPTGAGKSLCYQLPALLLPHITLVVSPLIALMKDQVDALSARGIAARQLDSTLTLEEYREVMAGVRSGAIRILYVAPERFNNERFREAMRGIPISLFAVDESHCISEWGHNFRPDYLKLAGYAKEFAAKRVLALTATATEKVLDDICRGFNIAPAHTVRTGFYRSNLHLLMEPVSATERDNRLHELITTRPRGATIVYVTLQKTAVDVAERLQQAGLPARAYHAGMKNADRSDIQEWFMGGADPIVVATIAFGMGIDKADIRYIYHYNLAKSLENYAQEIGRAGRDNLVSICHTLVCPEDLRVLENFVYGDTPSEGAIRRLLETLFSEEVEFDISISDLSYMLDIRQLVLRTLLTYLELEELLKGGTPFYANYQFKPILSSTEILGKFEGARRQFLGNVFRQAEKSRTWFHIDPSQCAINLNSERERVVRALDWLGENQMLEVKVAGVRLRYQRLKTPEDIPGLARQLHQRMLNRERDEIHRLGQVLELAAVDGCQTAMLATHFAEPFVRQCGHCSWCIGGTQTIPAIEDKQPPEDLANTLQGHLLDLDLNKRQLLNDPRQIAGFLCGVASPQGSRARLSQHPLFGVAQGVPFARMLNWARGVLRFLSVLLVPCPGY